MNPFESINWKPTDSEVRAFGKTLIVGMPIVAGLLLLMGWWKSGHWVTWPLGVGGSGMLLGALSWAAPAIGRPVHVGWHAIGGVIGWVVQHVLLLAVFYLLLTPIGFVLRLFRRDPLERKWNRSASTYWKDAEKPVDARRYFRQF